MRLLTNIIWSAAAAIALLCFAIAPRAYSGHPKVLSSGDGQPQVGEVVDRLGDNLMLVYQDQKNRWWFGTWGDGLYRYDGETIVHITTKHGLSHNRINQILEDSSGDLFFGTSSGVDRFHEEAFHRLPVVGSSDWALMPEDLWFTCPKYAGKVFRYDGLTLHLLELPKIKLGDQYLASHPGVVSPYSVYTIYRDRRDHVWFGTAAMGVCRYDGKSFQWLTSDDVNELHDGPSNGVRSIIEDHEGNFWFNTRYRYAIDRSPVPRSELNPPDGIFQRLPGMGSLDNKPDGENEFLSITKDRHNRLWIATFRHGAYCFDGQRIQHFPVMNGTESVDLFTVYVDRSGTVWLGTHANGAYRFNGTTFERFVPNHRR